MHIFIHFAFVAKQYHLEIKYYQDVKSFFDFSGWMVL